MRFSTSIDIHSPTSAVFAWADDPQKAMQWQTNVTGGEILQATPERVGTTFREFVEEDGQGVEMQGRITGYVPDKSISFHLESRVNVVDVTFSVESIPEGARVTQSAEVQWRFPVNLISLFMGGKMKQAISAQSRQEFARLKELCESK